MAEGCLILYEKYRHSSEHIVTNSGKSVKQSNQVLKILVLLFWIDLLIAFALSQNKEMSFWGITGWRMGLFTLFLIFSASYITVRSADWKTMKYAALGMAAGSFIVSVLSSLNRVGIYPITLKSGRTDFTSAIGNIDWTTGFLAISLSVLAGMFVFQKKNKAEQYFLMVSYCVSFMAAITLGTDTAWIIAAVLHVALFIFAVNNRETLTGFFQLILGELTIFCIIRLEGILLGVGSVNYKSAVLYYLFGSNDLSFPILFIAVALYLLFIRAGKKAVFNAAFWKVISYIVLISFLTAVIMYVVILAVNTMRQQAGATLLVDNSYFIFNDLWGSSRGRMWRIAVQAFQDLSPLQKLVGAGPDSFLISVYTDPLTVGEAVSGYGTDMLANAHCSFLTMAVNFGLIGSAFYISFYAAALFVLLHKARENSLFYVFVLVILSGAAYESTCFQQILVSPFMMIAAMTAMADYNTIEEKASKPVIQA